jgi:hypothetical protein
VRPRRDFGTLKYKSYRYPRAGVSLHYHLYYGYQQIDQWTKDPAEQNPFIFQRPKSGGLLQQSPCFWLELQSVGDEGASDFHGAKHQGITLTPPTA